MAIKIIIGSQTNVHFTRRSALFDALSQVNALCDHESLTVINDHGDTIEFVPIHQDFSDEYTERENHCDEDGIGYTREEMKERIQDFFGMPKPIPEF